LTLVSAEPERLLDLYRDILMALHDFDTTRTIYRGNAIGPVRLALLRQPGSGVSVERLHVDRRCRHLGIGSCTMQALVDFADLAGWTLTAEPRPETPDVDPVRLAGLFTRFGFDRLHGVHTMFRPPGPL
jgi:GNAT superfamily N-acetyltransferase